MARSCWFLVTQLLPVEIYSKKQKDEAREGCGAEAQGRDHRVRCALQHAHRALGVRAGGAAAAQACSGGRGEEETTGGRELFLRREFRVREQHVRERRALAAQGSEPGLDGQAVSGQGSTAERASGPTVSMYVSLCTT